ncbi:MAG: hypothetical protein ACFE8E_13940 [Candidatus Hodarchaeota archaeon]
MDSILKQFQIKCYNCGDNIEVLVHEKGENRYFCSIRNTLLDITTSLKKEEIPLLENCVQNKNWVKFRDQFKRIGGIICKSCELPYCKNCWTDYTIHREDEYDMYSRATCPKGHNCLIDQIL